MHRVVGHVVFEPGFPAMVVSVQRAAIHRPKNRRLSETGFGRMAAWFAQKVVERDLNTAKIMLASQIQFLAEQLHLELLTFAEDTSLSYLIHEAKDIHALTSTFLQEKIDEEQIPFEENRRPRLDWGDIAAPTAWLVVDGGDAKEKANKLALYLKAKYMRKTGEESLAWFRSMENVTDYLWHLEHLMSWPEAAVYARAFQTILF